MKAPCRGVNTFSEHKEVFLVDKYSITNVILLIAIIALVPGGGGGGGGRYM